MKVVIPGGSGQVGSLLARAFHGDGHEVVVFSRLPRPHPWRVVRWDGANVGPWTSELDGADVLINLTGRSVNCRYTPANKREILESRVRSIRALARGIHGARKPPRVWLQASTATIYAHHYDAPNDEASGIIGGKEPNARSTWRFSIDVATAWERAFAEAAVPHTRKVTLRSAMTMGPGEGGIFETLRGLVRRGLGGRAGDGRQFISWIHYQDFIRAIHWLIEHDQIDGVVNLSSPNPLPNTEFMRILREAAGVRIGLPAAEWMLAIGAIFMRTETELILKSRRVVPGRLLQQGFVFKYPAWAEAASDLCRQARLGQPTTVERRSRA